MGFEAESEQCLPQSCPLMAPTAPAASQSGIDIKICLFPQYLSQCL